MENSPVNQEDTAEKIRLLESRILELEARSSAPGHVDYQNLLHHLPIGVIVYNLQFEVVYINKFVASLLGFEKSQIPEFADVDLFHYILPEYHEQLKIRFQNLLKGEDPGFFDLRVRLLNGNVLDIQAKSGLITFNGKPGIQTLFLDVTAAKRTEFEKKENDKRVSMVLDSIDELVYFIAFNPDGTGKQIRYISSHITEILGIAPEEYINSTGKLLQQCHPEDIPRIVAVAEKLKQFKKPVEFVYRFRKEGSADYIWLEERVLPQINEEGEHIANLGILRIVTDRINYESKLRESEAMLNMVLNSIDEVVYYMDFSGEDRKLRFVSNNVEEIVGFTPEEFGNYTGDFIEHIHPDDIVHLKALQRKAQEEMKTAVYNYRFRHKKTGKYIWVEERVFPKYDAKGRYIANFGVTRNITEIKEAELSLKENEEKFRMLAENAQDVIFKFSFLPEPHYEYVSPSVLKLTGYTPEEFYADPYLSFKITHPGDLHILGDSEKVLREKINVVDVVNHSTVLRWIRKDGTVIWTETRNIPAFDDRGNMIALEGISRDITRSKKDEEALRDSEERFRILSNASIEGIILSERGIIIDINERFLEIFGFEDRSEVLGRPVRDFIIRDSKNFVSNRLGNSGPFSSFEIACRRKDGSEIFLEARGQNIPYNSKRIRITAINDITQRKLAENALKESERTLSTLLGNLPGMAYRCLHDEKWTMQFVNNGCIELTGFKPEDLLYNKTTCFADLVYPADRDLGIREIEQAIRNRKQFEIQYRIVDSSGNIKWVWEKGEGVFDEKGKLLFLEGFISDITARKHDEFELEKSKESYKNLIESSPDGIFIHDHKGEVLFANPSILKMLGVNSLDEIGTRSIYDYSLPEDLVIYRKRIRDLFEGKDLPFIVTKIHRKDGSFLEVESKPILFDYLGRASVLIFCRDISFHRQLEKEQLRAQIAEEANKKLQLEIEQRQRTERQLETTQKYTRRLIDSSLDMILATDKEGYVTEFNLAAQRTFGYTIQEVIGVHESFLYAQPEQMIEITEELKKRSGVYSGEVMNRKKNGELFTSFLSASVLRNDYGEVIGAMGVSRDITEIKKTEEQLTLQAAKLNSIIETSSHYIWTFNRDLKLTSYNYNYAKMIEARYGAEVEVGADLFKGKFVSTSEHNDYWTIKCLAAFRGIPQQFETSFFIEKTGVTNWMEVFLNPIYGLDKKVSEISGIGRDITEKKLSEEKLKQSLKEKEVLLKEVHHRVKNNLQVISSILNLQSSYVKDKKTLEILRESQNRIKSMSFIHESLYQTKDFSSINFTEYVTNLSNNLVHSYQSFEEQVELNLKIQDVYLNLDLAIPCGLIINEILSNALKYAFPKNRAGKIDIRLTHKNQEITLVISDNGIGLPAHIDYNNTESLGLQLVVTLVDQLGGSIKLDRSKGTKFTIVFRNPIKNA
ncbi:MAG TPA: PAS domain S-box protein [Bacteroidia bacterium]|jgi:PAS domain S-box-containing protein|nr:PAS domain S-box protein [Bacteroidia bacterium]